MAIELRDSLTESVSVPVNGATVTKPSRERLPILYEDDDEMELDLGEINQHVISDEILHVCLTAHFADSADLQVFSNMNLYYLPDEEVKQLPYVSPDTMVVRAYQRLPEEIRSYEIGRDGPAPEFVSEVLSQRTAQQRDLDEKMDLYQLLGVKEYLLVDVTGDYLPERLLLKRLRPNGTWEDLQDAVDGVTSHLGFRVIIDADNKLRVFNAKTGLPYVRPMEGQAADDARRQAEERERAADDARLKAEERERAANERIRDLEALVERLRQQAPEKPSDP